MIQSSFLSNPIYKLHLESSASVMYSSVVPGWKHSWSGNGYKQDIHFLFATRGHATAVDGARLRHRHSFCSLTVWDKFTNNSHAALSSVLHSSSCSLNIPTVHSLVRSSSPQYLCFVCNLRILQIPQQATLDTRILFRRTCKSLTCIALFELVVSATIWKVQWDATVQHACARQCFLHTWSTAAETQENQWPCSQSAGVKITSNVPPSCNGIPYHNPLKILVLHSPCWRLTAETCCLKHM